MSVHIYSGWDFGIVGDMTLVISESGGTDTITFASGKYSHISFNPNGEDYAYSDFATNNGAGSGSLEDELNGPGLVNGYWVTFSSGSNSYEILSDGDFAIDSGTNDLALAILGLSGSSLPITAATDGKGGWFINASSTSMVQPRFILSGTVGALSNITDEYEPEERFEVAEADDGSHIGVGPTALAVYQDFTIPFESKEATFRYRRNRAGYKYWTFQEFIEHCRVREPFAMEDDWGRSIHTLREKGAQFTEDVRERVTSDYELWDWTFYTYFEYRQRKGS